MDGKGSQAPSAGTTTTAAVPRKDMSAARQTKIKKMLQEQHRSWSSTSGSPQPVSVMPDTQQRSVKIIAVPKSSNKPADPKTPDSFWFNIRNTPGVPTRVWAMARLWVAPELTGNLAAGRFGDSLKFPQANPLLGEENMFVTLEPFAEFNDTLLKWMGHVDIAIADAISSSTLNVPVNGALSDAYHMITEKDSKSNIVGVPDFKKMTLKHSMFKKHTMPEAMYKNNQAADMQRRFSQEYFDMAKMYDADICDPHGMIESAVRRYKPHYSSNNMVCQPPMQPDYFRMQLPTGETITDPQNTKGMTVLVCIDVPTKVSTFRGKVTVPFKCASDIIVLAAAENDKRTVATTEIKVPSALSAAMMSDSDTDDDLGGAAHMDEEMLLRTPTSQSKVSVSKNPYKSNKLAAQAQAAPSPKRPNDEKTPTKYASDGSEPGADDEADTQSQEGGSKRATTIVSNLSDMSDMSFGEEDDADRDAAAPQKKAAKRAAPKGKAKPPAAKRLKF